MYVIISWSMVQAEADADLIPVQASSKNIIDVDVVSCCPHALVIYLSQIHLWGSRN